MAVPGQGGVVDVDGAEMVPAHLHRRNRLHTLHDHVTHVAKLKQGE